MHDNYAAVLVTAVFTASAGKEYTIFVGGRGSHFCEQCDTTHDESCVYFHLVFTARKRNNQDFLTQKCAQADRAGIPDVPHRLNAPYDMARTIAAGARVDWPSTRLRSMRVVGLDADLADKSN